VGGVAFVSGGGRKYQNVGARIVKYLRRQYGGGQQTYCHKRKGTGYTLEGKQKKDHGNGRRFRAPECIQLGDGKEKGCVEKS